MPCILDLVLTNSHCVNNIDTLAPLGKSDHAILLIETTLTNMGSSPGQKYNYNKGAWVYPGTAQIFWVPHIISGTDKATDFKFCRNIHRVDPNKSP